MAASQTGDAAAISPEFTNSAAVFAVAIASAAVALVFRISAVDNTVPGVVCGGSRPPWDKAYTSDSKTAVGSSSRAGNGCSDNQR